MRPQADKVLLGDIDYLLSKRGRAKQLLQVLLGFLCKLKLSIIAAVCNTQTMEGMQLCQNDFNV